MKIQCTDKKTFELTDGQQKLGQINYDSVFTHNALVVVGNDHFEINTHGIFSTSISVTSNGIEVANMQMSWKGKVIISLHNIGEYLLKAEGIFKGKYILEDTNRQQLLVLIPDFNWKKFNYNYIISYEEKPKAVLLVLLATYAANYHATVRSGTY